MTLHGVNGIRADPDGGTGVLDPNSSKTKM